MNVFKYFCYSFVLIVTCVFTSATFGQEKESKGDLGTLFKIGKGVSQIFNSPKTEKEDATSNRPSNDASGKGLCAPLPKDVGVVVSIPSLDDLDRGLEKFFQKTSDASISASAILRLTDYRQALVQIDSRSEIALAIFCESAPPRLAVLLPVKEKNFADFIKGLAQITPAKERSYTIGSDGKTANVAMKLPELLTVVARQITPDYVVLLQASDSEILASFDSDNLAENLRDENPPSLLSPVLSLYASPKGIENLTTGDRPFWNELERLVTSLETDFEIPNLRENLVEIREYIATNLATTRVDLSIDDYGTYFAVQTEPKRGSTGEQRVASYKNLPALNVDADRFFVVLPDVEAPISGQTEISPVLASSLPKPFDRLRYIEYSINLPLEGELAAESWQFYLEVDDAMEFVKETIIPKAREIGSYIGSKQAEEVGAQLFGSIAERRQNRRIGGGRPLFGSNPEQAAERGATLGSLIGSAVGANSAEQMTMKPHKFDKFEMYVTDLETYARQKALMKAEERGESTENSSSLLFDRNRPLLSIAEVALANAQNGEPLERVVVRAANQKAEQVTNAPLLARKSNIVILDKNHVLVGLGNETDLRYPVNNWKSLSNSSIQYLSITPNVDGIVNLKNLNAQIPEPNKVGLVSATRLDFSKGIAYYRWLAQNYLPLPQIKVELPNAPQALVASTVENGKECTRIVLPNKLIAVAFHSFAGGVSPLQLLTKQKNSQKDQKDDSEDLDSVFDK